MEPQPCPMLKGKLFLGHATEVDVHISHTKIPRLEMSVPRYNHRNWTISLVKPMGIPANPGGSQLAPET